MFAFRRFWPRPRFFGLFSAFLGLSRPFAPSSFLGKVGTFQSEFLPIFYPRHGNVFGGGKANVISITRGFAHTNTSPQHFQANIFTMPSSQFTPTFSHRDACLLFFHLLQHHWTPHLLPAPRACPHSCLRNWLCFFKLILCLHWLHLYRNFFRLPPVPFRWAWAPPFLTV